MDPTDQYFTHTIVGPSQTLELGKRQSAWRSPAPLRERASQALRQPWDELVVLYPTQEPVQHPRRKPSALRQWMERHGLALAITGLLALAVSAGLTLALHLP